MQSAVTVLVVRLWLAPRLAKLLRMKTINGQVVPAVRHFKLGRLRQAALVPLQRSTTESGYVLIRISPVAPVGALQER